MSSSGAPRNIEGTKSMNVWVIDMDTMKMAKESGENGSLSITDRMNVATRLIWIPGARPVNVPARQPMRSAKINSKIKVFLD